MNTREDPIVTGSVYHIFNKTLDRRNVFESDYYSSLFLRLLSYYRSTTSKISYSRLKEQKPLVREKLLNSATNPANHKATVLAFTLMPNHFHLLLHQEKDNGILGYVSDVVNAFTRHSNLRTSRQGPLFLPRFKSVLVRTDEYLMHVSRYIHLNPFSAEIIQSFLKLSRYPWSSYREYLNNPADRLSDDRLVMNLFGGDRVRYQTFVESRAEKQRMLEFMKHTLKWEKVEREKRRRSFLEP